MSRFLLIALLASVSHAATTTITDTISSAFGSGVFVGTMTITCGRAQTSGGTAIAASTTQIAVTNGTFTVSITPYDSSSPSSPCTVVYNQTDALGNPISSYERWIVPTTTRVLRIQDVLVQGGNPAALCPSCLSSASTYSDPVWLLSLGFNKIAPGTNTNGTFTVGSGSTWTYTGTGIINANKILGVTLTSLTGLVKMTAGVPSVAVAGTDYAAATNGTNGQGLTSNGAGGFGTPVTLAPSATTDTTNAANITSGTLPNARLVAVPNSALANSTVTITPSCGIAGGGSTALGATASINGSVLVNPQTGNGYTVVAGDCGKLLSLSNAAAQTVTLPVAAQVAGWYIDIQNTGAGTWTIAHTPTLDGSASTLALNTNQGVRIFSDGTNYFTQRGIGGAGSGTVTVVGAGTLTSTALVTGGGSQTVQTPNISATMDSSGNISTPGALTSGAGSGNAGTLDLTQGTAPTQATNAVTVHAPTSVTAYRLIVPGVSATGFLKGTNATNVNTLSFVGSVGTGSSVVLATALSGNSTTVATSTGTLTSGNCVKIDASGNLIDNGAVCGGGGTLKYPDRLDLGTCTGGGAFGTAFWAMPGTATGQCAGTTPLVGITIGVATTNGITKAIRVPSRWDTTAPTLYFGASEKFSAGGTVNVSIELACMASGSNLASPSYNTAATTTVTLSATQDIVTDGTITGITTTGCVAGQEAMVRLSMPTGGTFASAYADVVTPVLVWGVN